MSELCRFRRVVEASHVRECCEISRFRSVGCYVCSIFRFGFWDVIVELIVKNGVVCCARLSLWQFEV